MKVLRTEQIHIEGTDTISYLCHLSKNLFNQVNYILRGQFFKHERMISYKDLAKQFSRPSEIDENNNFQKLPAQTAQWTIKNVKQSWNSFFKSMMICSLYYLYSYKRDNILRNRYKGESRGGFFETPAHSREYGDLKWQRNSVLSRRFR